jgi:hypothetical protein
MERLSLEDKMAHFATSTAPRQLFHTYAITFTLQQSSKKASTQHSFGNTLAYHQPEGI